MLGCGACVACFAILIGPMVCADLLVSSMPPHSIGIEISNYGINYARVDSCRIRDNGMCDYTLKFNSFCPCFILGRG